MTTLNSAEFSRRFQDKSIDLAAVRSDARTSRAVDQALTRADANGDGRLEGPGELRQAFHQLDNFDKNGSRSSVETGTTRAPTTAGKAVTALTEASRPRRGITRGSGDSGAAASTSAPSSSSSGTSTRSDAYINGRRTSIETKSIGGGRQLRSDAADAFNRMRDAARRDGVNLNVVSAFRTMESQRSLYRAWQNGTGNLAAAPGYSNHQGGTALDIQTNRSRNSAAYRWLAQNGAQFGFANTVRSEPWHWEFRR